MFNVCFLKQGLRPSLLPGLTPFAIDCRPFRASGIADETPEGCQTIDWGVSPRIERSNISPPPTKNRNPEGVADNRPGRKPRFLGRKLDIM